MSTSNTLINYKVIGYEPEGEAIWIYIESNSTQLTNQITFENSLLNDFIKEQTNIIHFEKDGKKYSGKLNNPDKTLHLKF